MQGAAAGGRAAPVGHGRPGAYPAAAGVTGLAGAQPARPGVPGGPGRGHRLPGGVGARAGPHARLPPPPPPAPRLARREGRSAAHNLEKKPFPQSFL